MVIEDLATDRLVKLKEVIEKGDLRKLLTAKVNLIKEDDMKRPVLDNKTMLAREYNRGMYNAYNAILSIPKLIVEELALREEELAQEKEK